ncbi:MAG: hypothetical protein MZW92_57770 [Comamonadaceae bacterium]|nr:hypothetical protein [Comamonadaceae bacterium]
MPGAGDLRRDQGLRAVADRVAGRGTARQRRHRHRAVPGHHRDRDARRRRASATRSWRSCRRSLVGDVDGGRRRGRTAPAWPARWSACPAG